MTQQKNIIFILIGALLILGASFYFIRHSGSSELTLYGNVDIREVQLSFRISGKLDKVKIEEGVEVKVGDKLATLDSKPYKDKYNAAQAQVENSQANLDKLLAGARQSEIDQSAALLKVRQADLKNAEQQLVRITRLRQGGTVSQSNLDQATAQRNMAQANFDASRASLALLEQGSRKEDIAAGSAALAIATSELATAETALNDAILYAPSDGQIRSRLRESGTIVSAGEPIYVLALEKPLRVRGYIDEPDLGHIKPGQKVYVYNDTNPKKAYEGTIGFISPTAEFTPKSVETPQLRSDLVYRFWITLDPNEKGLRQGMPVTVAIPALKK